mmetsp:Transcript_11810/g.41743  ORF Transcript_11810/g.41743 Transcript_11810/m.41743 type:complete len:172 (+) Transcript_11810:133-648(+)
MADETRHAQKLFHSLTDKNPLAAVLAHLASPTAAFSVRHTYAVGNGYTSQHTPDSGALVKPSGTQYWARPGVLHLVRTQRSSDTKEDCYLTRLHDRFKIGCADAETMKSCFHGCLALHVAAAVTLVADRYSDDHNPTPSQYPDVIRALLPRIRTPPSSPTQTASCRSRTRC